MKQYKKNIPEILPGAQDLADLIDSEILADILRANERLDNEPVPLIGRYWWNPETNKVEKINL